MSLRDRVDWRTVRTGVLISLNGLSLWFLSVLVAVYATEAGLPWRTARGLGRGLIDHTRRWLLDPGLTLPEVIGYLGLGLALTGPIVAVIGRRLVARYR